jgi:hypothetical protein
MSQRVARFVHTLRLPFVLAVLFIAGMTSLPVGSHAATKAFDYQYYYDAAHTQPSGFCTAACYPGGAYCEGVITEYYEKMGCGCC